MTTDDYARAEFAARVRPLLISAVVSRDTAAFQAGGHFLEAMESPPAGYRVLGVADVPSIQWRLVRGELVEVLTSPGETTLLELASFDASSAEVVVAAWWDAIGFSE